MRGLSIYKPCSFIRVDIHTNPQASDRVQGGLFASRKKRAFASASLAENLQNPARMHVIAGSEYRVTTAASLPVVTRHIANPNHRPHPTTLPRLFRPQSWLDCTDCLTAHTAEFRELLLRHFTVMESQLPNGVRIP
ncbi:MAG: hypothetical protein HOM16_01245 [Woeseia sp.]|jgi:hypothetical protein|nr:hypothetical protein [Woeseia sp.]